MFPAPIGGYESRKCYKRIRRYLVGKIIDLGCGFEKICPEAIGIEHPNCDRNTAADILLDLSAPRSLRIFPPESFDVVFSSHCLEDLEDTAGTLKEWWRLVKQGGHMILYLPHADYSPHLGTIGVNPFHKKDFKPDDIITAMSFVSYKLISNTSHNELDEYAFELIFRKVWREYE